jgi:hypothetical protein
MGDRKVSIQRKNNRFLHESLLKIWDFFQGSDLKFHNTEIGELR